MDIKIFTGDIDRGSMAQMPAVVQVHAHNRISGLQQRKERGQICIGSAVRLYIGVLRAEQFLYPISCQILYNIHIFTAAVITFSGIPFRILIG